jgi:hypothetical protein
MQGAQQENAPEVLVRDDVQYGTHYLRPINDNAKNFCTLLGKKTLPWSAIAHIKALGFRVIQIGSNVQPREL